MARKKKSSAPAGQRQLRVGEEMRHALSEILREHHLDDPDLHDKIITVTEVRISPDLRNATAFVMPLGGTDTEKTVQALNRASGYFRRELGRAVKMQFTPTIRFRADETFDEASRIERLLHDPAVARDLQPPEDETDDEA
ncbi:30S ribosome-binding factor RbfA [Dongia deserti]|uniref:30S ribosome-binding factor RbfA n=1 Tax=Dongia deserti TaxID=2268030 RepID=UPI000E65D70A|nr:30S ribosome-binding factor RbfA [Dongia deserti]